jgi:peptide chain release factor 2
MALGEFWRKKEEAQQAQKKFSALKEELEKIRYLENELETLRSLANLAEENSPEEQELLLEIDDLNSKIEEEIKKFQLSGKYDKNSAVLNIQSGAGGRDAEDWVALLSRIYQRWAEKRGFQTKTLYQRFGEGGGPEGRIGLKEISMEIRGRFAYGLLKAESGVHRLVRISPFSAKQLRHTSFAKVEVLPKIEDIENENLIKPEDLKIETFRASGPGGQYVNRRESAVRITHLPTGLQASSQSERLQGMNRKIALQVLTAKIIRQREKEREKELAAIKGKKVSAEFGNQIRSYVFHPYKLVKDHRTGVETSNVEEVLDGEIDKFIEAELKL